MKITFTKSLAVLLLSAAVFIGCSKSDVKPNTEKITGKTWKYTGYGYDTDQDFNLSTTENQLADCEKDDTFTWYSDSTGIEAEGPVKCGSAPTYSFHWSTKDGNLTWNLYGNRTYVIKTLNETDFVFYKDEVISGVTRRELHKFTVK